MSRQETTGSASTSSVSRSSVLRRRFDRMSSLGSRERSSSPPPPPPPTPIESPNSRSALRQTSSSFETDSPNTPTQPRTTRFHDTPALSRSNTNHQRPLSTQPRPWPGDRVTVPRRHVPFTQFVQQELSSLFQWLAASLTLYGLIVLCWQVQSKPNEHSMSWLQGLLKFVSSWVVTIVPGSNKTCLLGGTFANVPIVLYLQQRTRVFPNLAARLCDWRLGKIQNRDFVMVILLHSLVAMVLSVGLVWGMGSNDETVQAKVRHFKDKHQSLGYSFVCRSFGDSLLIIQSTSTLDMLREALVMACFLVGISVLPVLLAMNSVPRPNFWTFLLLSPVYTWNVGYVSMGNGEEGLVSTLSPTLHLIPILTSTFLYDCVPDLSRDVVKAHGSRLVSQLLGAYVAAEVLDSYFPDERPAEA